MEEQKAIDLLNTMSRKEALEYCDDFLNDYMFYRVHDFWELVKKEINKP